jgi:hypothetical protein
MCVIFYADNAFNSRPVQTILWESLAASSQIMSDQRIAIDSQTRMTRRFAVFACSIHSTTLTYLFYAPILVSSWKRLGYETIVIFVGDFNVSNVSTHRLNIIRTYLKHVGAHIIDIQCNAAYAVKVSQVIRVFVGFLPDSIVADDDSILTTDSDIMPLRASEYWPTLGTDGFIFNAFCCGTFKRRNRVYRMFPSKFIMCMNSILHRYIDLNHMIISMDMIQYCC